MKNINRCIKPRVTDFNICPTLIDCIKSSFSAYFKLAWKMWLIRLSNAKKTDKKTKQKKCHTEWSVLFEQTMLIT